MKKENKRIAQERRAQERAKAAQKARVMQVLKLWVPIAAAILVLIFVIVVIATSGNSADNNAAEDTDIVDLDLDTADTDDEVYLDLSDDDDETVLDTTEGVLVEDGDFINLDYVGYIDGVAFDGGSTNGAGTTLVIGSGDYIEGFEEGIIGHAVGETFDLNLKFPDDYWNTEYAGKEVIFTTTVNGIYQ